MQIVKENSEICHFTNMMSVGLRFLFRPYNNIAAGKSPVI